MAMVYDVSSKTCAPCPNPIGSIAQRKFMEQVHSFELSIIMAFFAAFVVEPSSLIISILPTNRLPDPMVPHSIQTHQAGEG
jgi:hypothetical protein